MSSPPCSNLNHTKTSGNKKIENVIDKAQGHNTRNGLGVNHSHGYFINHIIAIITHTCKHPIIQLWKPFSFFASKPFFESTQEESFLRCSSSQAPYWCMHFPSFASYTCHTTYLCTLLFILFYFSFC